MKEVECVNCGETVLVPEPGEATAKDIMQLETGESALAHVERTGHYHVHEPEFRGCRDCGKVWFYTGSADRPSCPNCKGKRTVAVD